jgi:hypothetical protein
MGYQIGPLTKTLVTPENDLVEQGNQSETGLALRQIARDLPKLKKES